MPTKYVMCESDVTNLVHRVMKTQHQELAREKLKIDAVFGINEDGPAVMLHGYPCAATIKKVSYKNRVLGRGDAELTLDYATWEDLTDRQKDALIDHELTHLEIAYDTKTGKVKTDKAGRPRLIMRLHDWQLGGFADTAQRYGKDALEVVALRDMAKRYPATAQLVFEFMKKAPPAAAAE